MGCGVLCAVDPHAVGAWGVGSAVGITPKGLYGRHIQGMYEMAPLFAWHQVYGVY